LAYLVRAIKEGRSYRIYGYKGKQVRDNIHSYDVCTFFECFFYKPRVAAVYNLGGGRRNSISIIEAIARLEGMTGKTLQTTYTDSNRVGDHICYISDLRRIKADYPQWDISYSLDDIFEQLVGNNLSAKKHSVALLRQRSGG
jgi:CDP-paratose 2-epimerase